MMRSLQSRLVITLSACALGLAVVAGFVSYAAAFREAYRFQDDQLLQLAALVDTRNLTAADTAMHGLPLQDHDYRLTVQRLGGTFPATLADGFHTVTTGGHTWRAFVRTIGPSQRIVVAQPTEGRNEIARNSGLRTAVPFVVLVPLLIGAIVLTVRRAWRPVQRLAGEIDKRRNTDLRPLDTRGTPTEIEPFVVSINRLLARLAKALDEQRRFVADAAHELRSPVTALVIQAENLDRALAPAPLDAETRNRLTRLKSGLQRTRTLLEQLLTLARAQNVPVVAVTPLTLLPAVHEALEDVFVLADRKQIVLDLVDTSPNVPGQPGLRVLGTKRDIVTLLGNLVGNAVRYTPEGGTVSVRVSATGPDVAIDVIDSGPGIDADKREHVFDAFYRGSDQREPREHGGEGTGLGLAIVRAIVDRLGGRVTLKDASLTPPRGLHVRVTLPNPDASPSAIRPPSPLPPSR
ncbi:two-component sensor histidine kinase [Pandoraea nosoerga]|uniref:histidine kinase n=1 Tax=Pandoraea nosoerga TaxID=2508296 RepID=A0A5E4SRV5_9BURK|nr:MULTISPECIES: ATP-binding protein [Pandoraea]MBN4665175.1 two-component sensor histidine kinase [Pandoraea nosoerga]MBN4674576.1 two-component sensor histidine kinase [Pandoraea nosoerga]MBN4680464.1 two-component sensor histidine kinase [Pandoraea nosoerga]MBN4743869.1 two-component sensor histidine kinase [Pandoraea nosoerga]VVD77623.1 two-component sensor histidine kinase [Pandoraea nosoerga]